MKKSEQRAKLAKRILETEDKSVLKYIEAVLDNVSQWEEEMPPYIRKSFEKGIEDADAGRVIPHSEVQKMYKKWLKK